MPICGLLKRIAPAATGLPRNVTLPDTGQSFSRGGPHPERPRTGAASAVASSVVLRNVMFFVALSVRGNDLAVIPIRQVVKYIDVERFGEELDGAVNEQRLGHRRGGPTG